MASARQLFVRRRIPSRREVHRPHHLKRTLRELCAMGFIEKFIDDQGVERFRARLVKGRAA